MTLNFCEWKSQQLCKVDQLVVEITLSSKNPHFLDFSSENYDFSKPQKIRFFDFESDWSRTTRRTNMIFLLLDKAYVRATFFIILVMPISALENFLEGLEKTFRQKIHIFWAFEESKFSIEKFEKCGFSTGLLL